MSVGWVTNQCCGSEAAIGDGGAGGALPLSPFRKSATAVVERVQYDFIAITKVFTL